MMDGSNGGGSNSPAPFLVKTYEMVDDRLTSSVVSWSHTGFSFVVWNPAEFARDLLPKYFKHNNFSSFIRQLNTYGFRKIDPDQWEFANEEFIRGRRYLLKSIHRRKPIHSHSGQANSVPLSDLEREEFEKEIERLKIEKALLESEVDRHEKENQRYKYQLMSLGQTLLSIDQRQQQLRRTLAHLLQKRGYTSSLMDNLEPHSRKRRLLALPYFQDEADIGYDWSNHLIENSSDLSSALLDNELIGKLDLSLTFWEKSMQGIEGTQSEDLHEFGVPLLPLPLTIAEVPASSVESDLSMPSYSPECQLSVLTSRNCHSSPDLTAYSVLVSIPSTAYVIIDQDSGLKSSEIDVNVSPTKTSDTEVSKDQDHGIIISSLPSGNNDVFWQQFLCEAPGSSGSQEVLSERRELYNPTVSVGLLMNATFG